MGPFKGLETKMALQSRLELCLCSYVFLIDSLFKQSIDFQISFYLTSVGLILKVLYLGMSLTQTVLSWPR